MTDKDAQEEDTFDTSLSQKRKLAYVMWLKKSHLSFVWQNWHT